MSISAQDTVVLSTIREPDMATPAQKRRLQQNRWEIASIVSILALATFLDFYHVTRNGLGNNYYAIGVKSMMLNWHNFLYVSFDPVGYISIDKPPLGLWLQVISAKIFGFNGFALILPEALSGVVSVWLLYCLVRRAFGPVPALASAGLLAISPVNVVSNRDSILESPLVMVLLLATWAVLRATENGDWKWLSLGAVLIGLAFNIKMLEAFLIVPSLAAVYFCGVANTSWKKKLAHLYLAAMIMLAVSFSWAGIVNLTPPDQRPYIGSTTTNTITDLIFNYNGFGRYSTKSGKTQQGTSQSALPGPLAVFNPTLPLEDQGYPGPLRLIQPELGGQAGWFVPLALLGLLSSIWQVHPCTWYRQGKWRALTATERQFFLWTSWFAIMAYIFSFAGHMNAYYLAILAPAVAALGGIGFVGMWRDFGVRSWRGSLLIWALLASLAEQFIILRVYPPVNANLALYISVLSLAAIVCMALKWWLARRAASQDTALLKRAQMLRGQPHGRLGFTLLSLSVVTALLCLAPALWTFDSLRSVNAGAFPLAGTGRTGDPLMQPPHADPLLLTYLRQHRTRTFFLLGTLTADSAEGIINDTNAPVMAFGGWSGGDPTLTPGALSEMLVEQQIRYFLLPSANLMPSQVAVLYPRVKTFEQHYNTYMTRWIVQHCMPVPPQQWSASSDKSTSINPLQLFDCASPPALQ